MALVTAHVTIASGAGRRPSCSLTAESMGLDVGGPRRTAPDSTLPI